MASHFSTRVASSHQVQVSHRTSGPYFVDGGERLIVPLHRWLCPRVESGRSPPLTLRPFSSCAVPIRLCANEAAQWRNRLAGPSHVDSGVRRSVAVAVRRFRLFDNPCGIGATGPVGGGRRAGGQGRKLVVVARVVRAACDTVRRFGRRTWWWFCSEAAQGRSFGKSAPAVLRSDTHRCFRCPEWSSAPGTRCG